MEVSKIIVLLCCLYYGFASEHGHSGGHTIPVENYETELQYLGEHVEIPEHPVKVVKITKTVAVKIPVPYPVKVVEKVPYPVHVNKPYPVPVPQIVKVPHVVTPGGGGPHYHQPLGAEDRNQYEQFGSHQGNSYQVQEIHAQDDAPNGDSYQPENLSYNAPSGQKENYGPYNDDYSSEGSAVSSYDAPAQTYFGNSSPNDAESFESKSYEQAVRDYLSKINSNENNVGHDNYNNH